MTENAPGYKPLADRREQFLEAISGFSEDHWAAGWLDGIEEQVRAEGGLWVVMAAACQGWPSGYRAEHGWDPLTDEEARAADSMLGRAVPPK